MSGARPMSDALCVRNATREQARLDALHCEWRSACAGCNSPPPWSDVLADALKPSGYRFWIGYLLCDRCMRRRKAKKTHAEMVAHIEAWCAEASKVVGIDWYRDWGLFEDHDGIKARKEEQRW